MPGLRLPRPDDPRQRAAPGLHRRRPDRQPPGTFGPGGHRGRGHRERGRADRVVGAVSPSWRHCCRHAGGSGWPPGRASRARPAPNPSQPPLRCNVRVEHHSAGAGGLGPAYGVSGLRPNDLKDELCSSPRSPLRSSPFQALSTRAPVPAANALTSRRSRSTSLTCPTPSPVARVMRGFARAKDTGVIGSIGAATTAVPNGAEPNRPPRTRYRQRGPPQPPPAQSAEADRALGSSTPPAPDRRQSSRPRNTHRPLRQRAPADEPPRMATTRPPLRRFHANENQPSPPPSHCSPSYARSQRPKASSSPSDKGFCVRR